MTLFIDGSVWSKYPQDMLYARALSRLARRLFADIIGPIYVEGEIRGASCEIISREKEDEQAESLSLEEIDCFLESFGEDKPHMVSYIKVVSSFKKWSISRTVFELQKNSTLTLQKFENWKSKQNL